ncbi:hypothetical protein NLI96_g7530 [Meripilus lineatus]|uniref:Transmembrane protein n=1 Tax=Meripilus lineatus TaxID=2056292 RepID=A0AAD5V0S0_9APHY|nr:hypothetical protein NLI96_g7530 [Physisporinus lineatus]
MDLSVDSAGSRAPDSSNEGDPLLSKSCPTPLHDAKSYSETNVCRVPSGKVSDTPSPPDADPTSPMNTSPPPPLRSLGKLALLRSLLLPLVAIAYTVFCYTVRFKVIPVSSGGWFDVTADNIAVIKSGVTSISIITIGLGLLPIHSLISDLKSEEFFRVTSSQPEGEPLGSINGISNPSFGMIDSFKVVFRRHCSPYYHLVLVTSFLVMIISTLAPAALSVETALFDSDLRAFAVGALGRDDILNATSDSPSLPNPFRVPEKASALAWFESVLHVPYSFQVNESLKYVVPTPLNLSFSVPARWLSDVAIMNPTCTYSNPLPPFQHLEVLGYLETDDRNITRVALDGSGLTSDMDTEFAVPVAIIQPSDVYNTTDTGYPSNGAMVFALSRCISDSDRCKGSQSSASPNLDLSGLPVANLTKNPLGRPIIEPDEISVYNVAFLVCSPNIVIETREVRNDGHGQLTVMETSYTPKQGNLHPGQTSVMFSTALRELGKSGGPSNSMFHTESLAILLFGPTVMTQEPSNHSFHPLPAADITELYTRMLHSATKAYLDGSFSTAYVPGRVSVKRLVFVSSLPQVIASTILFVLLLGILILSHFRRTTPQFTLSSVAAALDGSEIPSTFAKVKRSADPKTREEEMGQKRVVLVKSDLGSDVLQLQ